MFCLPLLPTTSASECLPSGPFRDTPHLRHHQRAHRPENGPNHRSWKYLQKENVVSFTKFRTSKIFLDIVMFTKNLQIWGPWISEMLRKVFKNLEMTPPKSQVSLSVYYWNVQFIHFQLKEKNMMLGTHLKSSMQFQNLIAPFKRWKLAEGWQLKQNCNIRMINYPIILLSCGCFARFKTYEQINIIPGSVHCSTSIWMYGPSSLTKVCFKTPHAVESQENEQTGNRFHENSDNSWFYAMVLDCFIKS